MGAGAVGGGGGAGLLPNVGIFGFGLMGILALTHFLKSVLNFFKFFSHLKFSSNMLKRKRPLWMKPSFAIDNEWLCWLTLPILPLKLMLVVYSCILQAR